MSLAIVKRLERLNLAADPAEQLRAAVKATADKNSILIDIVLFPLLSLDADLNTFRPEGPKGPILFPKGNILAHPASRHSIQIHGSSLSLHSFTG